MVDSQKSYASILRQNSAPPQPQDKAFTLSAEQLIKFVANAAIQVAQPQVCYANPIRYKFNQIDREVFESTLEAALSSGDVLELKSTQDIDKYADFIVAAISTVADKAIPTSKSGHPESQPVSEESLAQIKEKRRLRRQYSQAHDPW